MQVIDRRSLIKSSALVLAGTALTREAKAAPLAINTAPFYGTGTNHATTTARHYSGVNAGPDWHNIAASTQQVLNYWNAARLDAVLHPQFATMTIARYSINYVNVTRIANGIRIYNPSVSDANVFDAINNQFYAISPVLKQNILNNIKANGIASYISTSIMIANNLATKIEPSLAYLDRSGPTPDILAGGQEPGCSYSAWGLFGTTLALLTLTVMTDGLGLLAAAGWDAVVYWGGQAGAGWSVIHSMYCGI